MEIRILMVDDDEIILKIQQRLFSKFLNVQIITSTSAENALEILQNGVFDLLIVDQLLPRMTGLQLIAYLKKIGNPIPAILFTGNAQKDQRMPNVRVIEKTCGEKALIATINELIGVKL